MTVIPSAARKRGSTPKAPLRVRLTIALSASLLFAAVAMLMAHPAAAQTAGQLHHRRLLAVPIGAMPPVSILMPASRNHNYLVGRIQYGELWNGSPEDRSAVGAGVDLQWRGGSSLGLTAGYQTAECPVKADCPNHSFFGGRARINVVTGGPTFASLIGDASATTTVGTEFGFGYAPTAMAGRNACALDAGMPISLSMFQRIRVVSFFSPGIAWDIRCPVRGGSKGTGTSFVAGAGLGLHQIGHRGLDVTLGAQRIFRSGAGIHLGITVTYVRLPQ